MVHQLRWDLRAVWPAGLVMLTLLLAKIWALISADDGRRSDLLSVAQADTYVIAAAWLVIALWQPMRPNAGREPDWRIRPLPRTTIALAKLLLMLLAIVFPVHLAELWLLRQLGFALPPGEWIYGVAGSVGLICGLSGIALLVRRPADLIGVLVTAGVLIATETMLAGFLIRTGEPLPPEIRGLRALTLVVTALVVGYGRLHNRSQTWLWIAFVAGLIVYLGLRLLPAAPSGLTVEASVRAKTPVLHRLSIQLPLELRLDPPGAYRVSSGDNPLLLDGVPAKPIGSQSAFFGDITASLGPEYRPTGPARNSLRLLFSVPPGELQAGPVTYRDSLRITSRSLSVAGQVPLKEGAGLRTGRAHLAVQEINLGEGGLELVVRVDQVHTNLLSPHAWRFALIHPARREVVRRHSTTRDWTSQLLVTRWHSRSTQVLRIGQDQMPIALERWLEGAELVLVSVESQASRLVPVSVDAFLDPAGAP